MTGERLLRGSSSRRVDEYSWGRYGKKVGRGVIVETTTLGWKGGTLCKLAGAMSGAES